MARDGGQNDQASYCQQGNAREHFEILRPTDIGARAVAGQASGSDRGLRD